MENLGEVVTKYENFVCGVIDRIKIRLQEEGYFVSPTVAREEEDATWEFYVARENPERDGDIDEAVDVRIEFSMSEEGVAPSLMAVHADGRILVDFCPCNYTPEVWVSLDEEIKLHHRMHSFFGDIVRDLRRSDSDESFISLITRELLEDSMATVKY